MHKSSFLTKVVSVVAIWGAIQLFFGLLGVDSVAAATLSEYVQDKIYIYNSILNGLYLLIWPALALAGFALDNSMVYGSLFGLDAPLFLIWNIIKNIANFILGFMVLFEILKNFFTTGEQGKKAFEVIKKALIAGVLIQASWFLMGAIIDISTIATYSIGGMPLAILGGENNQCKALGDLKTLPIGTKIDFTASNQNSSMDNGFQYYYYINKPGEDPDKTYFSPCRFYNDRWVIGQKYWGEVDGIDYVPNYCILPGNQFAYFTTQVATDASIMADVVTDGPVPDGNDPIGYRQNLDIASSHSGGLKDPVVRNAWLANGYIFDARSGAKSEFDIQGPGIYLLNGTGAAADVFAQAPMLKNIIEKSEGFVGVLITLYKSILSFVSFNTGSSSTDTFILFLEVLLKVGFGLALLIPLILLSIALVIRVGYIWMFIALSPIIALKIAFDDNETMKGLRSSIPIIKEKLGDIIRIIFAPVLITFAVSFCLVFMTALITSINNEPSNNPSQCLGDNVRVFESMNVKTSAPGSGLNKTYQIAGIAELQESAFGINVTGPQKDIFGWLLINLFGVAIVWLLLMTVIEAVFKGTPIGDMKLGQKALTMLGQVPIIPVPMKGGGWTSVGAGTLGKVSNDQVNRLSSKIDREQEERLLGITKEKKPETESSGSNSSNSTTTSATLQTLKTLDTDQQAAVIGAAATAGLGAATYQGNMPDVIKKEEANNINKSILTDDAFYKQYKEKIDNSRDKLDILKKDAEWIKSKLDLFSQDEFKKILSRNDDLANRLAPQADRSKIKLKDKESVLVFNADGTYTFEDVKPEDNVEYIPLINTGIPDRNKTLSELRTPSTP